MFNFTTETILNDLDNVNIFTDTEDAAIPTGEKVLYIKGIGRFPQPNSVGKAKVERASKAVGYADQNEVAELDLSGIDLNDIVGKTLRLAVDVELSGAEDGEYSRWQVHKGQPLYAEYFVKSVFGSTALLAEELAKVFNKACKKYDRELVVITNDTDSLVITATNAHQRIKAEIELILNAFDDLPVTLVTSEVTTIGREGFATTWFLTKNLRIPTIEATRFKGEFMNQRPLVNTIYNQYSIELEAKRNIGAQAYVGGQGTSHTLHIFYVPQDLATDFETDLEEVLGSGFLETIQP